MKAKRAKQIARHRREIGGRITAAREAKGLTLSAFAREVGVQPPTAWGWEHGEYSPGLDNLRRIATVLESTVDDLVVGKAA